MPAKTLGGFNKNQFDKDVKLAEEEIAALTNDQLTGQVNKLKILKAGNLIKEKKEFAL